MHEARVESNDRRLRVGSLFSGCLAQLGARHGTITPSH